MLTLKLDGVILLNLKNWLYYQSLFVFVVEYKLTDLKLNRFT